MADMLRVNPGRPDEYDVVIGRGALDRVGSHVGGATRVLLLTAPHLQARAEELADTLPADVLLRVLPEGESAKTLAVAGECWDTLGSAGFTRDDLVIGFGGGATTDLAGFVAATWLRGVAVVQVPTTTAGMVDAAVGGKTGINSPAGKNLIGAFHQPRAVIADLALLATLPLEEHRAGLAEVVKCGFLSDPEILRLVETTPGAALNVHSDTVAELVRRAVSLKAAVVGADFREAGQREILNYGHTLGHAIERAENYTWRHGDAVSVGMVFAAALSHAAGRLAAIDVERHRNTLQLLGLPVAYDGASRAELLATMAIDKKSRADRLRFVVLDGVASGSTSRLENPEPAWLDAAFEAVGM